MCDCCNNPSAKASATSSGTAVYNTQITTSASSTVTAKTYEKALTKATETAQKKSDSELKTTINNMNQTINVVNKNIITPINEDLKLLNEFKESATSKQNITLDGTVDNLKDYVNSIFIINYAASIINQNKDEIIANGGDYNAIIRPIFDKYYVGIAEPRIFGVYKTISNTTIFNYIDMLFSVNSIPDYNYLNNLSLEQIKEQYPEDYIRLSTVFAFLTEEFTKIVSENPGKDSYYYCLPYLSGTSLYTNSRTAFWYFMKDVVDPTKWIVLWGSIILNYTPPNIIPQQYYNLINKISEEITYIENFPVDNIWEYKNPIYFTELHCLFSKKYPSWIDKLIIDCYIPGSDINVPEIYKSVLEQLYLNFFNLEVGQIAVVTYSFGDNFYSSVCQIIEYKGKIAFSERQISINKYINTPFVINNDTVVNGYLDVKDNKGISVIKTDNVDNITSFNYKIGVNQELSHVKGLLDIDNLSNLNIFDVMDSMTNPLLYSYEVINDISPQIDYGTTSVTIPDDYVNDVCVFKTPVLNKIEESNITFLYVPSPTAPFGSKKFKYESFLRIQTIVNELNKMLPQYENFLTNPLSPPNYTFSFFELLNDTNYWYLNSLRAVLRVNPVDATQYEVFFVFTSLDINSYMVNKSYLKDFTGFTDKSSAANRFLNFCILTAYEPSVYNGLLNGNSIGSTDPENPYFTDAIEENPYFFNRCGYPSLLCFSDLFTTLPPETKILLNEEYSYLNNNPSSFSFLPNTDVRLSDLATSNNTKFKKQFGDVYQQTFYKYYYWSKGPKLSFCNNMPFNNNNYSFGVGINISESISESIVSKGDSVFTGNVSVIDAETESYIFSVSTVDKSAFSIYNTGIGTETPSCKLDILDCGLADVININEQFSKKTNIINYNIQGLIDAGNSGGEDAMLTYIENGFTDPTDGSKVVQTINDYYYLTTIPNDLNTNNVKNIYHWYYPTWNGQTLDYLLENDVTNRDAVKKGINNYNIILDENMFFDISYLINIYTWIFGIKGSDSYCFKLNNGSYYLLSNGVNLQNKLTVETNKNIQTLLGYYKSYAFDLQRMNVQLNSIPPTNILNEEKAKTVRDIYKYRYPGVNTVKYDFDFTTNTILYSILDFDTLDVIVGPININDETDSNIKAKLLSFDYKLKLFYYSGSSYLTKNNYGVLSFEDSFVDFVSVFYCIEGNGQKSVSILSLETPLNNIIQKSLQLKGDCNISGDLYLYDNTNNTNFLFSDSNNHFLGLNTLQVFSNYSNTYSTTVGNNISNLSKPTAYFRTTTYPNTVLERNAEVIDKKFDPLQGGTDYYYFRGFTTLSSRRESEYYSFGEMAKYSNLYTTKNPTGIINAFGNGKNNKYGYGSLVTYEVKDKSSYVKEVGSEGLLMESFDETTGDVNSGFTVYSNYTNPVTNEVVEKNLMYVSNDSKLSVNSIQLSGSTPTLYVDASGNLRFGDKYVLLTNTPP
jgi:hypothetical protein